MAGSCAVGEPTAALRLGFKMKRPMQGMLCEEGRLDEALQRVDQQGISISTNLLYWLMQECMKKKDLVAGRHVHSLIRRNGFALNTFLGSHLIHMFAQCGSLLEANKVFDELSESTVFTWNAIISAHTRLGQSEQAISLYHQMNQSSVRPNEYIFVAVLKACTSIGALSQGKLVHSQLIECGLCSEVYACNTLVDMYAKCGTLDDARVVFDKLPKRSLVTWNAMISGYTQNGLGQEALHLFQQMQEARLKPDNVTYVGILKACAGRLDLDQGRITHAHAIESGYEGDLFVGSTLVDMYAKCRDLADARCVFEKLPKLSVVTWNTMIEGYAQHGKGLEALQIFYKMQPTSRLLDKFTFVSILKACSIVAALDEGRLIHALIYEIGFELDLFVGNSLMDMYAKCGSIDDAYRLFRRLLKRDVVTWTAIIGAHVHHGNGEEALQLFLQMQQEGVDPNEVTLTSVLKACSTITALGHGKLIHASILESSIESDVLIGSALINMYSKCGSLQNACIVFDRLEMRSVVTWSAMMTAYALHGQYKLALNCFMDMQRKGMNPDAVTFVCVLAACSQMGLIDEGQSLFRSMNEEHALAPAVAHYTCMIGLLGHAGCLSEAEILFQTMPLQPDIVGWMSLLNSCQRHGNVEVGRRCFDHVVTMEGRCASPFVLMSNIYASADMEDHAGSVNELRRSANVWKKAGRAFSEIETQMQKFIVGETSHSLCDDLYATIKRLGVQMKKDGYVPHLKFVLQPGLDEDKIVHSGHKKMD